MGDQQFGENYHEDPKSSGEQEEPVEASPRIPSPSQLVIPLAMPISKTPY